MKTRKLLAFLLLLSLIASCMPAHAAGKVQVLHAYAGESTPVMYVALQPVSTGSVKDSSFYFYAVDGQELPVLERDMPNGHIMVVDRSTYYSKHITAKHVAQIAKTYLQLLPKGDLVKFIFADAPGQGTNYMSIDNAIKQMNSLTALTPSSALLSTAISNAFEEAASEVEGEPLCKTVAIIANPNNAAQAGQFQFGNVDTSAVRHLTIMVPTRAMYENAKNAGYANYKAGRATLNQLAAQMGGSYFEAPETGDVTQTGDESATSIDTSSISAASAYLNDDVYSFAIDISHLAELSNGVKGLESFRIQVKIQDENAGTFNVEVDRSILPTPTPTAVPSVTVTPGPTAIPIVIYPEEASLEWRKAMKTLIDNYYLTEEREKFDFEAQRAYDEFCEVHGIPMTDGISAEGYFMLTENKAAVKTKTTATPIPIITPTPTPTPSPTPIPVVPQMDLRIGDKDQDLPSNYVSAIQARLQELNCYVTEDGPLTYSPGELDEATMTALAIYCKAYGVVNTFTYGASQALCSDILTVKRNPITPNQPTVTPAPAIPAEGYKVGDTDANIPGGFIQAIQTRLQALNCYAMVDGVLTFTPGEFDENTMLAINAYCENYNMNNTVADGISASLCQDILNTERAPRETPTVSLVEKAKEFLMRPLFAIGTFQVIMWMAMALCVVLIVGIIIVVVMMRSNDDSELSKSSERMSRTPASGQNPEEYHQLVTRPEGVQYNYDSDKTMPEGVGSTVPEGFGIPVSLRIEYLDKVRNESPIITSAYTMGRRDCALLLDPSDRSCSSKHAMLYTENGQLFVRDLDSTNGTFVNGNRISKANDAQSALSDKTMILDEQDPQEQGYMLNRGDVIRMGKHRVTVQW